MDQETKQTFDRIEKELKEMRTLIRLTHEKNKEIENICSSMDGKFDNILAALGVTQTLAKVREGASKVLSKIGQGFINMGNK